MALLVKQVLDDILSRLTVEIVGPPVDNISRNGIDYNHIKRNHPDPIDIYHFCHTFLIEHNGGHYRGENPDYNTYVKPMVQRLADELNEFESLQFVKFADKIFDLEGRLFEAESNNAILRYRVGSTMHGVKHTFDLMVLKEISLMGV